VLREGAVPPANVVLVQCQCMVGCSASASNAERGAVQQGMPQESTNCKVAVCRAAGCAAPRPPLFNLVCQFCSLGVTLSLVELHDCSMSVAFLEMCGEAWLRLIATTDWLRCTIQ
jgi:hypothetical protein